MFVYVLIYAFMSLFFLSVFGNNVRILNILQLCTVNVIEGTLLRIFICLYYFCFEICLQILSLHPNLEYNIHFPMLRGDLNVHKGLGGSISAVLADLETIWGHCISTILNVPLKDLKVSN